MATEALPPGEFDYLVIGAGSAGSALVGELSQISGARILVLEAGGPNSELSVRIPARGLRLIDDPVYDWRFRTEPDPSRGGKSDLYYRGKGLGGSSAINGMVYVHGAPDDFDRWERDGAVGWGADEVQAAYRKLEAPLPDNHRRGQGNLHTRKILRPHETTDAFLAAAAAAGLPRIEDYNDGSQEGVALIQLTQRRGLRVTSSDAFLRPALTQNPNVYVALNSEVDRIEFEGLRAVGIHVRRKDQSELIRGRHIICCAGSINTPKLLMLSGIGDAIRLRKLGIHPLVDNVHVGQNLREHPLVRLQYKTRIPTYNEASRWNQAARHLIRFAMQGEGPITGVFEGIGFVKSKNGLPSPDLQLHFLPIAVRQDSEGKLTSAGGSGVTVYVNLSYPSGAGSIQLTSDDPRADPRIEYRLIGSDEDADALVRGMQIVQRIMTHEPMASLVSEESMPGFAVGSRAQAEARDYVRSAAEPAYHPVGTCAMGSGNSSVVSPRLQVNGVEGLWIADASVMPDLISGNTNGVCMMIGARLGHWLRERIS